MQDLTLKARELRKNMTSQEKSLWKILRKNQFRGCRFLRQYPIEPYIVDFVCRDKKIIIEIDGGQHNRPEDIEYDLKRTRFLNSEGYKVIRFWNNDIDNNIEGVYEVLQRELGLN